MFAKELMTVEPRAVTIHETATHAARLMAQYDVGILPVVDDPRDFGRIAASSG